MQYGFYVDQNRCTGCFTCIVACRDYHNIQDGASRMRVKTIEKGDYPDVFLAYLPEPCYHCAKPDCIPVCPVNAITKRKEDGIVVVDCEACLGKESCGLCQEACPYGSPQFGSEKNAKVEKCDFCVDLINKGQKPACVDGCPMRAMDAGSIDELRAKYGDVRNVEGFEYSQELGPSITYKAKQDKKRLPVRKTEMTPYPAH